MKIEIEIIKALNRKLFKNRKKTENRNILRNEVVELLSDKQYNEKTTKTTKKTGIFKSMVYQTKYLKKFLGHFTELSAN